VTVARPLSDENEAAVVDTLEAQTGKTIRLHVHENPDLIGGLIIRIGDRVFDGSVRNKLTNLHDRLRDSSLSVDVNGQAA
jgi:F-type H+-transporting ATPase subunit delta